MQLALGLEDRVIARMQIEQPESVKQEQQRACDVLFQIATHLEGQKNVSEAVQLYRRVLDRYDERNAKAMVALSQLHLKQGDLDSAQRQLVLLLGFDDKNNDAALVRGVVSFTDIHVWCSSWPM